MSAGELLTLRVRNAGSMEEDAGLQPDLDAEPPAVRYRVDGERMLSAQAVSSR